MQKEPVQNQRIIGGDMCLNKKTISVLFVLLCISHPLLTRSKKRRVRKPAAAHVVIKNPQEEALRREQRVARKQRRKEACKQFFSALLQTCLGIAQQTIAKEAAHLFTKMSHCVNTFVVKDQGNRIPVWVVEDQWCGIIDLAENLQANQQQGIAYDPTSIFLGKNLAKLTGLKTVQEKVSYLKHVQQTQQEDVLFKEIFSACYSLLPLSEQVEYHAISRDFFD